MINAGSKIVMTRTLPVAGEVLVQPGRHVEALDVVARAELPRRYRVINVARYLRVARHLGQASVDMSGVMRKAVGDVVETNEVLATAKGGLPFLQRSVRAPAAGTIAAIGPGWVLLETARTVIEIQAFINGTVTKIVPYRGVIIEANGAIVEAACGFGGEAFGRLQRLVDSPFESIPVEALNKSVAQAIILGGRSLDEAVLRQAEAVKVRGIIVGSIDAALLNLTLPVRVRVVATEGFGNVPMSPYTFGALSGLSGREISIRGQTPVLASTTGEIKTASPIIVSTIGYSSKTIPHPTDDSPVHEIKVGSRVRIIRGEWLGATGHIDSLASEPQPIESGLIVPGAYITIDDQTRYVPWANLEQVN